MKNLKVLFLSVCFLYVFTAMAEESSVASKAVLAETQQEEVVGNLEVFPEKRNVNTTEHTTDLILSPSNAYSDSLTSNRFLEFGLEYPTSFGANLKYLLTDSVYARFGLGVMSEFFLDSFEKIADSFGYLNQEEAKLLSDTLKNSLYLDFRLAWAPYLRSEGGGPYLELGLFHSRYGKGELRGINLSQVLDDDSFETAKYLARTNTYNASFHVGYQIPFEKMKLNFEIGLIKIFHAELLDEAPSPASSAKVFSESQQRAFQDFLETKGWIFPTFSGWISFAF